VVLPALRRYADAVRADGEEVRFDKCCLWRPGDDDGSVLEQDPAYVADCAGRPRSEIVLDGKVADFYSAEGGQQGDPSVCADYVLTTHATAVALDAELAAAGGCARFQVDDGTVCGPADVVLPALRRYADAVRADGEEVRFDKCCLWRPGDDDGSVLEQDPAYVADCAGRPRSEIVRVVRDGGLAVNGVPFGSDAFVHGALRDIADDQLSYIHEISSKLRSANPHVLWALLRECVNTRIYHLAQCVYPEDGVDMFRAFDAAMLDAACDAFGGAGDLVRGDSVASEALRLPVRLGGGGLRSSADLSPVAFCGTVCSVAPTMVTVPMAGTVGFLPQLAEVLGTGPFNGDDRFEPLCGDGARSASRLGRTFHKAWGDVTRETAAALGGRVDTGPLAAPAVGAGLGVDKPQREMTRQRESAVASALYAKATRLPETDARRAAFEARRRCCTARGVLTAPPAGDLLMRPRVFAEAIANLFGLASPALAPHVGKRIRGANGARVDPRGDVFFMHERLRNRDGVRAAWSGAMEREVERSLRRGDVAVRAQVRGLFDDLLTPPLRHLFNGPVAYAGSAGPVPDLMWRDANDDWVVGDIKTAGFGKTRFWGRTNKSVTPADCRASSVHTEMAYKLRRFGKRYMNVPTGVKGPLERRLDELGPVQGLVVDVFGELSRELRDLLVYAAEQTAARTWVEDGATSCDRAAAILKQHLYRRWGVVSARAVAQTRLNGLRYVGANPDFANAPPAAREAEADDRDRATAYTFAGGD